MTIRRVLVPYNFSRQDQKAIDFVTGTFGGSDDIRITLFNTYASPPDIPVKGSPVMEKMSSNLIYLGQKASQQKGALEKVQQYLEDNGCEKAKINIVFRSRKREIASEIVTMAVEGNYDIVVINRTPGKISGFFSGNVYNKVVGALKGVVVCVVS